jgi:hypothetical protein
MGINVEINPKNKTVRCYTKGSGDGQFNYQEISLAVGVVRLNFYLDPFVASLYNCTYFFTVPTLKPPSAINLS